MTYQEDVFQEQELAALRESLQRGYRTAARSLMAGWLKMYNRGTHQNVSHTCPLLGLQYNGLQNQTQDATDQLSGGWKQLSASLRDGGRMTCSVYIEIDESGKLYRRSLMGAMVDQTIERFRLEVANPGQLGFTALQFDAFVFVGRNLGLSTVPSTKVDLEITGEVLYLEN
jgi:hypothetical protein